jgi:hypothetical protein
VVLLEGAECLASGRFAATGFCVDQYIVEVRSNAQNSKVLMLVLKFLFGVQERLNRSFPWFFRVKLKLAEAAFVAGFCWGRWRRDFRCGRI